MSDFLLSIPGRCSAILAKVTTLATDYTTAKAAYLDAAISSRAAAATALSNAVWTATRAAALDTISALSANLSTMLQRPAISPPTTFGNDIGNYTSAKKNAIGLIDGVTVYGPVSPGAGVYSTVINEVGRGVVNFLALVEQVTPASGTKGWRVTIDGVVFTGNITGVSGGKAACAIGAVGINAAGGAGNELPAGVAFENVTFLTGFKVEFTNSVAGGTFYAVAKYRRTG